jgi:major membrane immunogen (membrane-anchored lipoprotein)
MMARVALVAVVLLAACHKGSAKLQGHWKGTRTDGVAAEVRAQADKWAGQVDIEFKGDVMTVTTPNGTASSKYKVAREDKGSITIITDADGTEETLAFESDTTLKWTALPGKTITLTKQ